MSIATEITRLQNAKASIKTSIENKGVTVPSVTKLDGYSALIDSIQTGITPTGTISITTNGTVDVTNYASADVNVSGGGQQIGIQTPNANPLAMLYALEHGTAKTGEFTLATTLPNTAKTIFDAQDTSVKNFVIMAEGEEGINTGTTTPATFLIFMIWLQSSTLRQISIMPISCRNDNTSGYLSIKNKDDISIASSSTPLLYAYWDWVDGVLQVKAQYNKHVQYTPFKANTTYRWVAW